MTRWTLLGVVVGIVCGTTLFAYRHPPDTLTNDQKTFLQQRLRAQIEIGQSMYQLPAVIPPWIEFTVHERTHAAESVCQHDQLAQKVPFWGLRVNERLAARNWDRFVSETMPHEIAHLLLCQFDPAWDVHSNRWESVVRDLGATPNIYHTYEVPQ